MAGETIVTVIGNLVGDPEVRSAGGAQVTTFTVASTPRSFNKQTNEWEDGEPLFLRASAWRELGEHVAASLVKGTRVIVQGRLSVRSYEKDGQKRTSTELEVDAIGPELRYATVSIERRTGNRNQAARREQFAAQGQPPRPAAAASPQQPAQQAWGAGTSYDDEAPF